MSTDELSAQMEEVAEKPKGMLPRLIEPDPKEIVLCVYEPTLDGFMAAWVVRRAFKEREIPVEFSVLPTNSNVGADGRNAIELGTFPDNTSNGARSLLRFDASDRHFRLPEPLPFKDWERVFPYGVKTLTKAPSKTGMLRGRSLVGMAWDFFNNVDNVVPKRPFIVDQVDDRVAGTKKFRDSADTYACLDSYPHNFVTFDRLAEAGEDRKRRDYLITGGQAINRMLAKFAGKMLRVEAET